MSRPKNRKRPAHGPVVGAFDPAALARVCVLPEDDFAEAFAMKTVQVSRHADGWERPGDFYHFRDNGSSILAVAHLDTVVSPRKRTAHFTNTEDGPVVFSGALDDRLGAYIVLEMLPRLGITYDVLLTTGEEYGQSTAEFFTPDKEYNWMIEFDRGGTDVVMYQYDDADTRAAVRASGARPANGIFSDISYMDHLGVKGFNWGVGYQDYHSTRSHAFLNDTFMMVNHYLKFHEMFADVIMPHQRVPKYYTSSSAVGYVSVNGETYVPADGDTCVLCQARSSVDRDTNVCGICKSCQDCGGVRDSADNTTCDCHIPGQGMLAISA